jgi:hypothetical protein
MLVGVRAAERLHDTVAAGAFYPIDIQTVTMPWGQPLEAALATPREDQHGQAEHGRGGLMIAFESPAHGHDGQH